MKVLVTGGAGYIGSHVVRRLGEAGHEVVVYDNLSTGNAWALLYGELVEGDLGDSVRLDSVLARGFDAVLHFAAHIVVPESVSDPLKYYSNNTANTLLLWKLCVRYNVPRVVFSSTAAVYGLPVTVPVPETAVLSPVSPYGASKMMSERMLMDAQKAGGPEYAILRYFNVAGADPEARIGQATPDATHLIKVACEAATGKRSGVTVFGTDYPTPDGTCVRDYIHVEDLAEAHLKALEYLVEQEQSTVLNCGYGHGFSVREVIDAVRNVSGVDFPVSFGERRAGDPAALIAQNERIRKELGWKPQYDNLEIIVKHAFEWEKLLGVTVRTKPRIIQD